jgi:purine nucleosidase
MLAKIIIDTDIGDDIDDAFAIAYALQSGLNIVGITTVFRNAERRTQMASALLRSYNVQCIPICAGIDTPLIAPILARDNDHYAADGSYIPCQYMDVMDKEDHDPRHAVDFLIESAQRFPGQITLVPIGPLTNVAMAIRKAPGAMRNLKGITLMGGVFEQRFGEWNILCDPEAARIVFTSGIPLRAVGLDVTMKCRLEQPLLDELKALSANTAKLLCAMMDKWFEHYRFECPVLHDPLTIGTIVGDFVTFENKTVLVGLDKEHYGFTTVTQEAGLYGASVIATAVQVDHERYLKDFKHKVFE